MTELRSFVSGGSLRPLSRRRAATISPGSPTAESDSGTNVVAVCAKTLRRPPRASLRRLQVCAHRAATGGLRA